MNIHAKASRGMVLVSVLWVMVAMTLAASVFSLWVDRSREQALRLIEAAEYEQAARSIQAAIIYARITSGGGPDGVPLPSAGVATNAPMFDSLEDFLSGAPPRPAGGSATGYLRLAGDVLGVGAARVMVRDRGGLIGLLGLTDNAVYARLAERAPAGGVSAARLRDTLADYMDADQLHSLLGAEAPDYQRLGRAPPLDGTLRSPLQLRDVLGWDEVLAGKSDAWLLDVFRVEGSSFVNGNTASPAVLELILPEPGRVSAIIERRRETPFRSVSELSALAGGAEDAVAGIEPVNGLRIWRWQKDSATAVVDDIQFDPFQPGRDAIILNWSARVGLSEELAERPVEQVDHPIFHSENFSLR